MQRLGKNLNGYHGETIDIRAVLREIETAAPARGWTSEIFHTQHDLRLDCAAPPLRSDAATAKHAIHISAGIHGDEPAGPLAALKLIQEDRWPGNAEIFLLPCLNPLGFTPQPARQRRRH